MRSFFVGVALAATLCVATPAYAERVEVGNLVTVDVPATSADVATRLRQYQNTRSARFADWAPDGKGMFISTRFGEVPQIHTLASPMAAREQLGFYDEPVYGARTAPGNTYKGFAFQKDIGGNENYQVYFHDLNTGTARMLTDGISRNQSVVWNTKGDQLAYMSNRRTGKGWDVYMTDPKVPGDTRMIVRGDDYYWIPVAFSPDDKKILMVNYISINHSTLAIVEFETGATTYVNDAKGPSYYGNGVFTKDGKGLYFTSDVDGEFRTLRHMDIETGYVTTLTGDIPWDVKEVAISPNGKHLAFVVNRGGYHDVMMLNVKKGTIRKGPDLPPAVVSGIKFSSNSKHLAMTVNTVTSPSDVYSYSIKSKKLTRWTKSEVGGLDTDGFRTAKMFNYPTFDEVDGKPRSIPAMIMTPKGEGPHPVIIRIHGGPEGQALPTFSSTYQYWANELGFAVIQPNVRGSAGYGKSYLLLDNGFKREDSVKDIGALLDWVKANPELDENRVVLYGGSYGGYMVLAGMVHYADRLLGAIDVVGISNFVTFLENTKAYRRDLRRVEYGDERDPAMRSHLQAISPLNHVEKMTKPLFIVQGMNDPRVPVTESEQMLKSLQGQGSKVWYMMAKDEGHGFRKKSNRDAMAEAMAMFLKDLVGAND